MAVTLSESAKLSNDQLAQGVMELFIQESAVLDRLPFMEIQGNAYKYNEEATLPGVAWRGVNEAFPESTGSVNPKTEALYILGGDADVDTFIVKTRSNLTDQKAHQTRAKVKALSYEFQDAFINGDNEVNSKQFDGIKKRATGNQVISAATNGLGPIAGGHDFLDSLDALIAAIAGGPDALYMNSFIKAKVRSTLRRLGGWQSVKEAETGKLIDTYLNIPLLDIGTKPDGSQIITQTETQGSSNLTSSIYAVKFGPGEEADQAVTGLTNGGVSVRDLGEVSDKPAHRVRVEFFPGIAVFGGRSIARLKGVLNS
ncbi:MAG TPA: hypothetical protein VF719_12305 [Abditibacteriaceae bacterium]|jgi:hypothetical protein